MIITFVGVPISSWNFGNILLWLFQYLKFLRLYNKNRRIFSIFLHDLNDKLFELFPWITVSTSLISLKDSVPYISSNAVTAWTTSAAFTGFLKELYRLKDGYRTSGVCKLKTSRVLWLLISRLKWLRIDGFIKLYDCWHWCNGTPILARSSCNRFVPSEFQTRSFDAI